MRLGSNFNDGTHIAEMFEQIIEAQENTQGSICVKIPEIVRKVP